MESAGVVKCCLIYRLKIVHISRKSLEKKDGHSAKEQGSGDLDSVLRSANTWP